jgi:hypothetical protein
MSKPDPRLLNQMDAVWDNRNQGKRAHPESEAARFFDAIDSLHRTNTGRRPSDAFRSRIREQLLADSSRLWHTGA